MSFLSEFKEFVSRGSVVDLAVGVIVGGAFGKIVDALVGDVIMPVVGSVIGKIDFSNFFIPLAAVPPGVSPTLAALKKANVPVLAYGSFLTVVINFIILALIIFVMVKQVNKLKRSSPAPVAAPSEEILLLRDIRNALVESRRSQ